MLEIPQSILDLFDRNNKRAEEVLPKLETMFHNVGVRETKMLLNDTIRAVQALKADQEFLRAEIENRDQVIEAHKAYIEATK